MTKALLFALVCMVVFTGCAANLPAVDWCYRFDFRATNYGFFVTFGSWVSGVGFIPSDLKQFEISYVHTEPVSPDAIILTFSRVNQTGLPIRVAGRATLFGMRVDFMETVAPPEAPSRLNFYVVAPSSGASDKVQFTGETSEPIALEVMQVRGNGANPFPSSNCDTAAISEDGSLVPGIELPSGIVDAIVNADDALSDADLPLTAPDGQPLLPAVDTQAAFGYAKWLLSPAAAQEIAGPFSGILSLLGIYLVMNLALLAIYGVIYAVVYIIRWVIWLIRMIAQVVQAVVALVVAAPILVILAKIIAIIGVITGIAAGLAVLWEAIKDFFGG